MIVQAHLYPVARSNSFKGGKRHVTFINSWYGNKDSDGLFVEVDMVDCWLPGEAAELLRPGHAVSGVVDVNDSFTMMKEIEICGVSYIISDKGIAAEKPEPEPPAPTKKG